MPTELEAGLLASRHTPLELCGFGLAQSGARAMHAIATHRPARVVLAGVAGSYDPALTALATVVSPSRVRCLGIGAGGRSAAQLGFADADELPLAGEGGLALSVAAASGSPGEADARLREHPGAVIEEMEGYAVALAAMIAGIPCCMVRGVSNRAGDRNTASWQLAPALEAVGRTLDTMLGR